MKKINVLLVDDDTMFRECLCGLLKKEPFVSAVYEAHDEAGFLHQLHNHSINFILLDIKLKTVSGLELLEKIGDVGERPSVIALTGLAGSALTINLLRAGFDGIVYKLNAYQELVTAITQVLDTGSYLTPEVRELIRKSAHKWGKLPPVVLSYKEMEVLKAIASGIKTDEMATLFKMTPGSTRKLKRKLMNDLGVRSSAAVVAYAYENGIL
jgi:DNA-binding NarL/FixJ family response regulator